MQIAGGNRVNRTAGAALGEIDVQVEVGSAEFTETIQICSSLPGGADAFMSVGRVWHPSNSGKIEYLSLFAIHGHLIFPFLALFLENP